MKTFLLLLVVTVVFGCVSKSEKEELKEWEAATNYEEAKQPLPVTAKAAPGKHVRTYGISGTVYLKDKLSTFLPHTKLSLYRSVNNRWILVHNTSTDIEGKFSVGPMLRQGKYQLRVVHPKYLGYLPISLNDSSERDLIFEVMRK